MWPDYVPKAIKGYFTELFIAIQVKSGESNGNYVKSLSYTL